MSSQNEARAAKKQGLSARLAATTLLTRVIDDRRNFDALCDHQHGIGQFLSLDRRDQGLARAIVVSALRHRNHIDAVIAKAVDRAPPKRARLLLHTLHVAIAQILFLDVADSAAVDLAVTAIGNDKRTTRFKGLANAVLRRVVREKEKFTSNKFAQFDLLPKWFSKSLRKDYGKKKSELIAQSLALRPSIDITPKGDPKTLAEKLGGTVLPLGSLRLQTQDAVTQLAGFEEGEWWVQDAAASIPAKLISAPEGSRVLELCAAPGGKTAQLANAGFNVTALDISKPRLARLQDNLDRLNFKADLVEADILEWEAPELFDAVLLDAPCSSTGTACRHPDVMWTRSAEEITELAQLQFQLVMKAFEFIKPGGQLVFSNCSMMKEEGEDLLVKLLAVRDDLALSKITADEIGDRNDLINGQGALRSLPSDLAIIDQPALGGMDGFFACRFIKVN
jgi:16S rRNA (cytosine967-C5)-methyltransferase